MYLIRLALKNLTRHKKRTFLTAGIIAFAVFFYIFLDSLMLGMRSKSFANIINYESGHMQISNKNYWVKRSEFPLDNLISEDNRIEEKVKKINGFQGISPQLKFMARLNNGVDEIPVPVRALKPAKEKDVYKIDQHFIKGEYFAEGEYKAVIGKELADLMNLKIDDYFTLIFRTKEDTFNTVDLQISGLINTPNPNINSNRIFIPLSIAQNVLNVENKVSQYAIRLSNNDVEKEVKLLNQKLDDEVAAFSWRDSASSMINLTQAQKAESQIILGIILIIAALGIINTIVLAGIERIEEIGMMKALGMSEKEIILSFVYESTGIGAIGSLIGALAGVIFVFFFHRYGVNFFKLMGDTDLDTFGMPLSGRVYGEWNVSSFIFVIIFVMVISSIVSIFPAIWAARKDVTKAIHHKQ